MMVVVEVMAVVVVGVAADHVPSRQMWHMTRLWGGMWGWGRGAGLLWKGVLEGGVNVTMR